MFLKIVEKSENKKLLEKVTIDQKEFFEDDIKLLLWRLREHYDVWSKVLAESQKRKGPKIRRVK